MNNKTVKHIAAALLAALFAAALLASCSSETGDHASAPDEISRSDSVAASEDVAAADESSIPEETEPVTDPAEESSASLEELAAEVYETYCHPYDHEEYIFTYVKPWDYYKFKYLSEEQRSEMLAELDRLHKDYFIRFDVLRHFIEGDLSEDFKRADRDSMKAVLEKYNNLAISYSRYEDVLADIGRLVPYSDTSDDYRYSSNTLNSRTYILEDENGVKQGSLLLGGPFYLEIDGEKRNVYAIYNPVEGENEVWLCYPSPNAE